MCFTIKYICPWCRQPSGHSQTEACALSDECALEYEYSRPMKAKHFEGWHCATPGCAYSRDGRQQERADILAILGAIREGREPRRGEGSEGRRRADASPVDWSSIWLSRSSMCAVSAGPDPMDGTGSGGTIAIILLAARPSWLPAEDELLLVLRQLKLTYQQIHSAGTLNILKDSGFPQNTPQILYTDSLTARLAVLNPLNVARIRCIDIRYKWIIEQVKQDKFAVQHIRGMEMPADGLDKATGQGTTPQVSWF
ncbi:8057742e-c9ec-4c39-8e10-c1a2c3c30d6b [Thermothielavioides terrestris]|uniref:8057742e-c9ec-4c39-8e10-c1a2c3c30d6b n=1 Tax=Thermothielavioides terrestris TaxID=2587410 RepID=A0A3S4B8S3_9PEZI|nr:8057742e-c9ec-4c39-8e10-c1a2c3c30d6b [Thermothielavioides terrestris]